MNVQTCDLEKIYIIPVCIENNIKFNLATACSVTMEKSERLFYSCYVGLFAYNTQTRYEIGS